MIKNYTPSPISTEDISLSEELISLSEKLAKNTHEVWSKLRMEEGWEWGPVRNCITKKHPCLVSYEELSENEKDYDRRINLETIKLILKCGYVIKKKET